MPLLTHTKRGYRVTLQEVLSGQKTPTNPHHKKGPPPTNKVPPHSNNPPKHTKKKKEKEVPHISSSHFNPVKTQKPKEVKTKQRRPDSIKQSLEV